MPTAVKKHPIPKKLRLLILLAAVVLTAVLAAVLLFAGESHGMPKMKLRGKTYACGTPFEMTEDLYVDLVENYDCMIGTRTVDGEEFISALSARKRWPDSKPNRAACIGGLRLGDSEAKLLRKYPMADTNGLQIGALYNPDETWEHFTVYFYEEKPYSPTEYDALLQSVPEGDVNMILIHSYALVVLTIQDEIDCVVFGDYSEVIRPLKRHLEVLNEAHGNANYE